MNLLRRRIPHDSFAEDIWWLMHHSDDPSRRSVAITCYCDDGGSQQSDLAMLGGLVMNRQRLLRLDKGWRKLLHEYRIDSIHMRDFVRPNGRNCGMYPEMKKALFASVAKLIHSNRAYSIVMSIPLQMFNTIVPVDMSKNLMRPYAMALFLVIVQNSAFAEVGGYSHRLSYLMDRSDFEDQMLDAHAWIAKWEEYAKWSKPHVGPIAFDSDENNTALQAADVIVWSSHRRMFGALTNEFEPLRNIFAERFDVNGKPLVHHIERTIPNEGLQAFVNQMNAWINGNGKLPDRLSDTVV